MQTYDALRRNALGWFWEQSLDQLLANAQAVDKTIARAMKDLDGDNSPSTDNSTDSTDTSDDTGSNYNPAEPRIPAGQPGGGQWTTGGGTDNGDTLSYPDGTRVIDPNTGQPYLRPPGLDIQENVKFASDFLDADNSPLAKTLVMVSLFRAGGAYDYQRPDGLIAAIVNGDVNDDYTDVTNYNYGVIAAAFGYSEEDTLNAAGAYNRYFGNTQQEDITRYCPAPIYVSSFDLVGMR